MLLKEKQKAEAIKRMKKLKILNQPIKEFKEDGKLNLSERHGILYWLDDEERKMVEELEQKYNFMAYHVIKTYSTIGLMYSILFVSEYEEEWEMEMDDIEQGYAFVYTVNKDMPECSEFGTIGIRPCIGGVERTY